jgi:hypothetical protein
MLRQRNVLRVFKMPEETGSRREAGESFTSINLINGAIRAVSPKVKRPCLLFFGRLLAGVGRVHARAT